jgi:3-methylcrotonyl-CoA carboxylase alpha subunit
MAEHAARRAGGEATGRGAAKAGAGDRVGRPGIGDRADRRDAASVSGLPGGHGRPFSRVLIANRGEIAVRVARTLRRLGIESVAVYSDADADAPHVRAADRALRLGPAPAAESYLHVERVIDAALQAGAEAIHPGYGFLSERPDFARACIEAGLTFVGPSPEAMALLGDKVAAKETAAAAGVPVVPGLGGAALTDEEIVAWVEGQELPLLLKAAAGGGGKGMRVVRTRAELPDALAAARREARAAFGDDRLLVERYLERPRHIEVQVIGDQHGTVLYLGERECSLQRRHQKVIEEAPSPVVGAELRERMGEAAAALARRCGYTGAGTVELIADRDDPSSFYFLEMNARLQVEHPVTELVTGLDLVELQLRVAAGEPLGLAQEDIALDGHAIEARVYAEDPANGFLPSTGRVALWREPEGAATGGAGCGGAGGSAAAEAGGAAVASGAAAAAIRIDSGISTGTEVTSHYDPMLAKVIAHGPDRPTALARLDAALRDLRVIGPTTNAAYLRALLARPEVQAGELDTTLIERLADEIAPPPPDPALPGLALIALLGDPPTDDPWDARTGWRLTGPATARMRLEGPAGEIDATARPDGAGGWWVGEQADGGVAEPGDREGEGAGGLGAGDAEADGERAGAGARGTMQARLAGDALLVEEAGAARRVELHHEGEGVWLVDDGVPYRFAPARDLAARHAAGGSLDAPMPGVVLDVRTQPGAAVSEGDVLVVLESMKMELAVQSPGDGVVGAVLVSAGDRVAQGDPLIALEEAGAEHAGAQDRAGGVGELAPETPLRSEGVLRRHSPATGPARSTLSAFIRAFATARSAGSAPESSSSTPSGTTTRNSTPSCSRIARR